jgi:hypothetical protein
MFSKFSAAIALAQIGRATEQVQNLFQTKLKFVYSVLEEILKIYGCSIKTREPACRADKTLASIRKKLAICLSLMSSLSKNYF